MSAKTYRGMAQTVLGPVSSEELGPTTTHEHLLTDLRFSFSPPNQPKHIGKAYEAVSLDNLGWVRFNHFNNLDNLVLDDIDVAIEEVALYKESGGGTIVDVTPIGISRTPEGLARISRSTNINIIMGSGYYVDDVHPNTMDQLSEEYIASQIVHDITKGVGDTGIKSGIIGEIGCSWPLTANERKVLRAAASAQLETGAPILIHPGRAPGAPSEILDILSNANADITRTVIGHLDRTYTDTKDLLDLASSGCYLEYDLFGIEVSYFPLAEVDMASDAQRLDFIQFLVDAGYQNRIVIAQDICRKERLVKYGGYGYAHILENIIPWLIDRGLSHDQIDGITTRNPAELLSFV